MHTSQTLFAAFTVKFLFQLRTYDTTPRPRYALQAHQETCSKTDSVLGSVKDALKVAEQTASEYITHFSEGLREDVREVSAKAKHTFQVEDCTAGV